MAGNEGRISQKKRRAGWNKKKSKTLLQFYGVDVSDSESDEDDEFSDRSRVRRLQVARTLGITGPQLNFAKMEL